VDGGKKPSVHCGEDTPDHHASSCFPAPRNWSLLVLKSTLKVVKLP
jgi:hypothetical protein